MHMKCGVITFHRVINYGGVLQTYAMQKCLEKLNIDNDIIDYRCPFLERQYYSKHINYNKLKRIAYAILKNGTLKPNIRGFAAFREKYLHISEKQYNNKNIYEANKKYDFFITGSDQVWSYYCAGFDKNYFLEFVKENRKKNSYAASFGVSEIPMNYQEEYKKLLSNFNMISVREDYGKKIVKEITNREATVVLDPTLLLDCSEWEELLSLKKNNDKYVLVYMIVESQSLLEAAKKIANDNNYKIIYINDRIYPAPNIENKRKVCPKEWVELLFNAQIVITNSYHGISFCINFGKEFYMQFLESNIKVNARLEYLLQLFGLQDRCLKSNGNFFSADKIVKVKSEKINEILQKKRKASFDFLRQIFLYNTIS